MIESDDRLEAQILQVRLLANSSPDGRAEVSAGLADIIDAILYQPGQDASIADTVRLIIKSRRLRLAMLGDGLFADPAWDMLLELYLAKAEGRAISITSLCHASQVPTTTALRHIQNLEDHGLVSRRQDESDSRRIFMDPSDAALTVVEAVAGNFSPRTPDHAAGTATSDRTRRAA